MTVQLSDKFLKESSVIFFPHTKAEAIFIQRCLFEKGIGWKNNGRALHSGQECIDHGMIVLKGVIYTLPTEGVEHFKGVICDVTALSPHFNAAVAALEHRIAQLEAQVEELGGTLKPVTLSKPTGAAASKSAKKAGR